MSRDLLLIFGCSGYPEKAEDTKFKFWRWIEVKGTKQRNKSGALRRSHDLLLLFATHNH